MSAGIYVVLRSVEADPVDYIQEGVEYSEDKALSLATDLSKKRLGATYLVVLLVAEVSSEKRTIVEPTVSRYAHPNGETPAPV